MDKIIKLKSDAYDLLKEMNKHLDQADQLKQKIFELEKLINDLEKAENEDPS